MRLPLGVRRAPAASQSWRRRSQSAHRHIGEKRAMGSAAAVASRDSGPSRHGTSARRPHPSCWAMDKRYMIHPSATISALPASRKTGPRPHTTSIALSTASRPISSLPLIAITDSKPPARPSPVEQPVAGPEGQEGSIVTPLGNHRIIPTSSGPPPTPRRAAER